MRPATETVPPYSPALDAMLVRRLGLRRIREKTGMSLARAASIAGVGSQLVRLYELDPAAVKHEAKRADLDRLYRNLRKYLLTFPHVIKAYCTPDEAAPASVSPAVLEALLCELLAEGEPGAAP
jgi:transcriptional regulator with XRE-family HTH domain